MHKPIISKDFVSWRGDRRAASAAGALLHVANCEVAEMCRALSTDEGGQSCSSLGLLWQLGLVAFSLS